MLNLIAQVPIGSENFAVGDLTGDGVAEIITPNDVYSWDKNDSSLKLIASQQRVPGIEVPGSSNDAVAVSSLPTPLGRRTGFVEISSLVPKTNVTFNILEKGNIQTVWTYQDEYNYSSVDGENISTSMGIGNIDADSDGLNEVVILRVKYVSQGPVQNRYADYSLLALDSYGHKIWESKEIIKASPPYPDTVTLANLIGDSKLECLVRLGGNFLIFDSKGQKLGQFKESLAAPFEPVIIDTDGDGIKEVLISNVSMPELMQYHFVYNNSELQISKETISIPGSSGDIEMVAGDISADDKIEIAFVDDTNGLEVTDLKGNSIYSYRFLVPERLNGTELICDCDGDGKTELLISHVGGISVVDLNKPYNLEKMVLRMYQNDPQRTRCYKENLLPPQWVKAPADQVFWFGEAGSLSMMVNSKSTPNSALQISFEGLPSGIQKEETVSDQGKTVTLKWTPTANDAGLYPVNAEVVDDIGLRIKTRFTLNVVNLPFIRGDANMDGKVDISDGIYILNYLFNQNALESNPLRLAALDVNDNGVIDISDAISLFSFLFSGGPAPKAPYPSAGVDPTTPNSF